MFSCMIWLYRLLFIPGVLLSLPYYLQRMWKRGGYKQGLENRFGMMLNVPKKRQGVKRIWIQAVSVGELNAIAPLIDLLEGNGRIEVILTTTTSTGRVVAESKYKRKAVWIGNFPLDFFAFSARAWKILKPDVAILMEGELWPEHIHQARARNIPVLLLNGRLSDKSFRRHRKWAWLTRHLLGSLNAIYASNEGDCRRFRSLGWIDSNRVHLMGNVKFDVDITPELTQDRIDQWIQDFGFWRPELSSRRPLIILGSSTWPGEEEALINHYKSFRKLGYNIRLLIVPRHAERKEELKKLEEANPDLRIFFRTDYAIAPGASDVYIADTTGELRRFTELADIVFVGKTLPPHYEGQTPIEAAALGKPIVCGPKMTNFRAVMKSLQEDGILKPANDAESLGDILEELISDSDTRDEMARAAQEKFHRHRGASKVAVAAIFRALM